MVGPDRPARGAAPPPPLAAPDAALDDHNRLCRVVQNALSSLDLQALAHPCTDAISGGAATVNVSTRYTYDRAGNLASMIDPANHTTLYAHDAPGHLASTSHADGQTSVYAYDHLCQTIRHEQ